jgi:DNA mismatch repair protein MutS
VDYDQWLDNLYTAATPVMRQWIDAKREHRGFLMLFRMGDFYECFYDDAAKASSVLSIALTKRGRVGGQDIPMCGVPAHAINQYVKKLIENGVLVAICEQTEDAAEARRRGNSLVNRQVTRLVTPGTVIEDSLLNPRQNNFLLSISHNNRQGVQGQTLGISWIDISTGQFYLANSSTVQLMQDLDRINPAEVLIPDTLYATHPALEQSLGQYNVHITVRPAKVFEARFAGYTIHKMLMRASDQQVATQSNKAVANGSHQQQQQHTLLGGMSRKWKWTTKYESYDEIKQHFSTEELAAAAGVLEYTRHTQGEIPQLNLPSHVQSGMSMQVDPNTRQSLELVRRLVRSNSRRGSLLDVIDQTVTPAGSRLLHMQLNAPLLQVDQINARLDKVEFFWQNRHVAERLREMLQRSFDLQRSLQRISMRKGGPRDLAAIGSTLVQSGDVARLFVQYLSSQTEQEVLADEKTEEKDLLSRYRELFSSNAHSLPVSREIQSLLSSQLHDLRAKIANAIRDDPPLATADGNFVRVGYDAELDKLRELRDGHGALLRTLEERYRQKTGIWKLRIRRNNILGHFVEIPPGAADTAAAVAAAATQSKDESSNRVGVHHSDVNETESAETASASANASASASAGVSIIPQEFVLCQTLKTAWRYKTLELTNLQDQVNDAAENARIRELEIFAQLSNTIMQHAELLTECALSLAQLDVSCSLGLLARDRHYTRPVVTTPSEGHHSSMRIQQGRHAIVEAQQQAAGHDFTANDCTLSDHERVWLITGPNMAGKSTFLRQTALLCIMAQMGSFVPAQSAQLDVVDRIFSRVGGTDDIARDKSSFMMEMMETTSILRNATKNSLVIMDEVGRGTSTFDGLALALAIVEHLHGETQCRTLFATHYHEMQHLEDNLAALRCYNMTVYEPDQGPVTFLHRIQPGVVQKSYGVHVARLAGMPEVVSDRAEQLLSAMNTAQQEYRSMIARIFGQHVRDNK